MQQMPEKVVRKPLPQSENPIGMLFAGFADHFPGGIYIYQLEDDEDATSLRLHFANPASQQATGVSPVSVIGKRITEAFPALANTPVPAIYHRLAREGGMVSLGEITYADDAIAPSIYQVTAFGMGSGTVAVTFENVTGRKRLEAENLAHQRIIEKRAGELQMVADIVQDTTALFDVESLLQSAVELTKAQFELYHAHIYLLDKEKTTLHMTAGAGEAGRIMQEAGHSIALDRETSLVARAARTRRGVIANDVRQTADFLPNPLLPDTRAEMAIPMVVGNELIGVLDVQSDVVGRFDEHDVAIKSTLAAHIAIAIQNARFVQEMQVAQVMLARRAAQMETVGKVATIATTELDLDRLLHTSVNLTRQSFALYHAHIYLYDAREGVLKLAAGAGEPGRIMRERGHTIPYDHPNSLVAQAARTTKTVIVNDVTREPNFLPNPLLPDTRSEIAIPMTVGDTLVGVLDVQANVIDRFDAEDGRVFEALASQIAVAVENARAIETVMLHETAIQNSTSGMTIADARLPDMPLIYINPAFETITGYTMAEAMNQNCRFLQRDDHDQPGLHTLRAAIKVGQGCIVVLRNYRKDGTLFYNELHVSPIRNYEGVLTHFVGVQTDITERMTNEQERERLLHQAETQAQAERAAAARLRQLDRMKSQFLANMSHELRTPLNSIIGYSEIMIDGDDGELSEEAVEDVTIIHSSGKHLLSIINDVLDLAKIEAGEMRMEIRETDAADVIEECVRTAQILVKDKPVGLDFVRRTADSVVKADPIRLRQVVMNLISNAAKFTEAGSVTVTLEDAADGGATIAVTDTGIGIDEDDQRVIFEQFRQVDESSTRRAGGTGLGLTITRHLVQLQGGDIAVQSAMGQGTTMRFTLPRPLRNSTTSS